MVATCNISYTCTCSTCTSVVENIQYASGNSLSSDSVIKNQ